MKGLVGQTLGAYRIREQIGRGGMATVFKAYQPTLDRYVAIKILPPHFADEPGFSQRFEREARAVAKLEHPHILAVYDSGQEDDLTYLVMRYVEAGTLKAQMGHPLDLDRVTDLIGQISEALDYAHEQGIVHRDIKPSNILMDRGDWALLTDFGLAKMIGGSQQITETGVGLGTPDYMSPEQGMGEHVDRRSDIYSLGVVLYEMLTGRVPYKADTPMAVVLKHMHEPLPLPREINPEIPEAVERVVLKAMAKDPADRFERAGDLAEALREAIRGIEVSGVGLSPTSAPLSQEAPETEATRKLPYIALGLSLMVPVVLSIAAVAFLLSEIPIRVQVTGGRLEFVSIEQRSPTPESVEEVASIPTSANGSTSESTKAPDGAIAPTADPNDQVTEQASGSSSDTASGDQAGQGISRLTPSATNQAPEYLQAYMGFQPPEGVGSPQLIAKDPVYSDVNYQVSTGNCLEGFGGDFDFVLPPATPDRFDGTIILQVTTQNPIVIQEIQLELTSYQSVNTEAAMLIWLAIGQGGGGGDWVPSFQLDHLQVPSHPIVFNVFGSKRYELPSNGAVDFEIPVTLSEPGIYLFKLQMLINEFAAQDRAPIDVHETIAWLHVDNLDPNLVDKYFDDVQFGECG